jgi:hypothetical protein
VTVLISFRFPFINKIQITSRKKFIRAERDSCLFVEFSHCSLCNRFSILYFSSGAISFTFTESSFFEAKEDLSAGRKHKNESGKTHILRENKNE